jgi:integration host factor subunit beta
MTKRELIDAIINEREQIPRREVEDLVNAVFDSLAEALARGERIEIRGFGSFIVKRRNAREGRNPKTGEIVSVVAKRVPFFKAGKELKLRVDGKNSEVGVMVERIERSSGGSERGKVLETMAAAASADK